MDAPNSFVRPFNTSFSRLNDCLFLLFSWGCSVSSLGVSFILYYLLNMGGRGRVRRRER